MERRSFLKIAGLGSISLFSPNILALPALGATSNRTLIIIELKGGNDGLNTVIPYTDKNYYSLRPDISVSADSVLRLSDNTGLNPALEPLMKIWQDKQLAIVSGVGYPQPNRSHFRSIEIWETASDSEEVLNNGWLSRLFSAAKNMPKHDIDGIIIGQGNEGPLSGINMRNLVMENPEKFVQQALKIKKLAETSSNKSLAHILQVESNLSQFAGLIEKDLAQAPPLKTVFPETNIGKQFATAAKLIAGKIPMSVIKLTHGSFDTHSNQRNQQDRLLKELATSLSAFRAAMVETGRWNDTLLLTYSEFGRRAGQNGSKGTDHGTAAPHFILGGKVKGGLYGRQPALDDLVEGDLKFFVDYRSLYSTVVKSWWNTAADFLVKYPTINCLG
jgi:uncharacterized protein (DUF1501 family)